MIWLIGCKGMLGQEVARQLYCCGLDFVGTDIDVDITDKKALESFAESKRNITHIINCSAYTDVDRAESDKVMAERLNKDGPENIAGLAYKIGATMIHISTDYVFGSSDIPIYNIPITEEKPVSPGCVYGATKAAGEKAVMEKLENYYIFRTAWLYGWAGKNFVYTMIKAINNNDVIKVVDDQKGTPTFAGDLADLIINVINKELCNNPIPYGLYNFTDLGETTWFCFANEIKKQGINTGIITNEKCVINPCTTDDYKTAAKRPAYSVLCKDKIQKALSISLPRWQDSLYKFMTGSLNIYNVVRK